MIHYSVDLLLVEDCSIVVVVDDVQVGVLCNDVVFGDLLKGAEQGGCELSVLKRIPNNKKKVDYNSIF